MGDLRDFMEPRREPDQNCPSTGDCRNKGKDPCWVFTAQPISYAMAYVPYQCWGKVYEPGVGFERGTIFPELDKPFIGEEAVPNER